LLIGNAVYGVIPCWRWVLEVIQTAPYLKKVMVSTELRSQKNEESCGTIFICLFSCHWNMSIGNMRRRTRINGRPICWLSCLKSWENKGNNITVNYKGSVRQYTHGGSIKSIRLKGKHYEIYLYCDFCGGHQCRKKVL